MNSHQPDITRAFETYKINVGKWSLWRKKFAKNSIGVNEAFKTFVSVVKEIQKYLSNDLTKKRIAAIAPTSDKVVSEGASLKQAIQDVQTAIQNARAEMSRTDGNQLILTSY